jgi:hypothetical protein
MKGTTFRYPTTLAKFPAGARIRQMLAIRRTEDCLAQLALPLAIISSAHGIKPCRMHCESRLMLDEQGVSRNESSSALEAITCVRALHPQIRGQGAARLGFLRLVHLLLSLGLLLATNPPATPSSAWKCFYSLQHHR